MSAGFLGALLRRAEHEPDRILFTVHEGESVRDLTQAGLIAAARIWAGGLEGRGALPGSVVLIALPLGPDLLFAFLGACLAGCVPSFMPCPSVKQDSNLFWSSHHALFTRMGGGVIATTPANASAITTYITEVAMTVVTPAMIAETPASAARADVVRQPGDIACLQHSSGTTGLKKGVMLGFDQIDAQLVRYAEVLDLRPDDTIVSWLPLYHDMGFIACFLLPLARGNRSVLIDPFAWLIDPLVLFDLIQRHGGSLVWLPNFAFNHLVNAAFDDERRADLGSVRAFIDCSEPCKVHSLAAFDARFRSWGLRPKTLLTCYAMAETVFAVTQSAIGESPLVVTLDRARLESGLVVDVAETQEDKARPQEEDRVEAISAGRPLRDVEIAILDEAMQPAGGGQIGEIAIRAPFLFSGYHLEPERTATVFHCGFYRTGDLGFLRDGNLFVLGRRDDLIILLGRNVFANEIEAIAGAVPGVKPGRIYAMSLPDEDLGSQSLIVVAECEGSDADPASIRTGVRSRLESILGIVPRQIMLVEPGWLVKSTSGKMNRGENRRKYLACHGGASRTVTPNQEGSAA